MGTLVKSWRRTGPTKQSQSSRPPNQGACADRTWVKTKPIATGCNPMQPRATFRPGGSAESREQSQSRSLPGDATKRREARIGGWPADAPKARSGDAPDRFKAARARAGGAEDAAGDGRWGGLQTAQIARGLEELTENVPRGTLSLTEPKCQCSTWNILLNIECATWHIERGVNVPRGTLTSARRSNRCPVRQTRF